MPSIKKNLPPIITPINEDLLYFETHERSTIDAWVLLVHGAGGSTRTWKKQIEQLGVHYNLLIIDLPGHGKNARNSDQFPNYSFLFMADIGYYYLFTDAPFKARQNTFCYYARCYCKN